MINVLILAYDFPPYVSVGGLRPYHWYKYFHRFDIYPIVVTRQWSNLHGNQLDYISKSESSTTLIETNPEGTIIRTPYMPNLANRIMLKYGNSKYSLLRRGITAFYEFSQWLWKIGPKSELYAAANLYLKTNKVDIILATGEPFILFSYAAALSKEFKTPWIADYRDPWTQRKIKNSSLIFNTWNAFFEKKIVKSAAAINTVSDFCRLQITRLIKDKQINIITNGFDAEAGKSIVPIEQPSDILTIGFAGTIYDWHPIKSILSVIKHYLAAHPLDKIHLNFYGINIEKEMKEMLSDEFKDIQTNVTIVPKVPNDKILLELSKNNVLLLFNDYSILGTKIFDYLISQRKILLCYANDSEALQLKEKYYTLDEVEGVSQQLQAEVIETTTSGYIVKDAAHLHQLLGKLCKELKEHGKINSTTNNIDQYSRQFQTARLAEIIKTIGGTS